MKKLFLAVLCLAATSCLHAVEQVLMVADEFPAMEYVASRLMAEENVTSLIAWQTNLPPDLSVFPVVMAYIHGGLKKSAEKALIAYTRAGGKLIVLHHSISSGKRKNREWFDFLGVKLPEGEVSAGGYKWIEGVTQQIVNLAPDHFITTNKVDYPERVAFKADSEAAVKMLPAVTLNESEVYLNHILAKDDARKLLLGVKFTNKNSGETYMQTHTGWTKPAGKGRIIYLQPGHDLHDFKNPTFERILLNAIIWEW